MSNNVRYSITIDTFYPSSINDCKESTLILSCVYTIQKKQITRLKDQPPYEFQLYTLWSILLVGQRNEKPTILSNFKAETWWQFLVHLYNQNNQKQHNCREVQSSTQF